MDIPRRIGCSVGFFSFLGVQFFSSRGLYVEVVLMTDEQKKLITRLRQEGCGYTAIAKKMELSRDTVRSFCRRNGLSGDMTGEKEEQYPPRRCRQCGNVLSQTKGVKQRIFCSRACREKWWKEHPEQVKQKAVYSFTCACCGKPFTAYGNSKQKYCSHECYIRKRFKGGDADG